MQFYYVSSHSKNISKFLMASVLRATRYYLHEIQYFSMRRFTLVCSEFWQQNSFFGPLWHCISSHNNEAADKQYLYKVSSNWVISKNLGTYSPQNELQEHTKWISHGTHYTSFFTIGTRTHRWVKVDWALGSSFLLKGDFL